jgi:hypothetical protein
MLGRQVIVDQQLGGHRRYGGKSRYGNESGGDKNAVLDFKLDFSVIVTFLDLLNLFFEFAKGYGNSGNKGNDKIGKCHLARQTTRFYPQQSHMVPPRRI